MSSQTTRKQPPKVRQACDACHARKIRCDGKQPCLNCNSTSLACTYLAIPKKKGPKGPSNRVPRAVLKMQMRQEQTGILPPSAVPTSMPASMSTSTMPPSMSMQMPMPTSMPMPGFINPDIKPSPSLNSANSRDTHMPYFEFPLDSPKIFLPSPAFTYAIAEQHINSFFKYKYPVFPILNRDRLLERLRIFHQSPEIYSLIAALCGAVISQTQPDTGSVSSPQSSNNGADLTANADFFLAEVKRARQHFDYIEKPSLADVQTSFFLFATLFNVDRHNSAWFVLREAMTMLQMMRLHEEESYQKMEDKLEALYSRRTFWLMFLTERAYALQRHRPLTLQRTIDLPYIAPDDPEAPIISGFFDLISLFQSIDDNFVALWNISTRTHTLPFASEEAASMSARQLAALQEMLAISIPDVNTRTEVRQADLLISRQWLKTMVWQLCVTKGLLSSAQDVDESMSFHYPVLIARDLVKVSGALRREAFEPHGQGILEKVFDVGCSLADVLQLQGNSPAFNGPNIEFGPRDYLKEMLRLMQTTFGGSSKYLAMLASRADECFHYAPQHQLNYPAQIDSGRITELEDDDLVNGHGFVVDHEFGPASFHTQHSQEDGIITPNFDSDSSMFDFGSLSEASMAWLGAMDESQFTDGVKGEEALQHG